MHCKPLYPRTRTKEFGDNQILIVPNARTEIFVYLTILPLRHIDLERKYSLPSV